MPGIMNSETALNLVAVAIRTRGFSPTDRWIITVENWRFHCVPASQGRSAGTILGEFNETELKRGLSRKEWERIRRKISHWMKIWK